MASEDTDPALPTMPSPAPAGPAQPVAAPAAPNDPIVDAREDMIGALIQSGDMIAFAADWLNIYVFTLATAVQVALVVSSLVLGVAVAAIIRPSLVPPKTGDGEDNLKTRVRRIVGELLAPVLLVVFLNLANAISYLLQLQNQVIEMTTSLSIAWIFIRLFSKLIMNAYWGRIFATIVWIITALSIVGVLDEVVAFLDSLAIDFGETRISLYMVAKGGIVAAALLWLALATARLLQRRVDNVPNLTPSVRVLVGQLARFLLIVIAIVVALNTIGIDLTAFAVFSGALGVGIGFGLQKIVSNVMSGIILLLDRSVRPGDVIEIAETYGEVRNLGARYTSVKTRDGTEHLIPNEELIASTVINWSHTDRLIRIKAPVGISYGADIDLARQLVIDACNEIPRIMQNPPVNCLVQGFGDSSVDLEARFWVNDPEGGVANIRSEVFLKIWHKFKDNGIEIPFPQRDLHIKSGDLS
jgi:small-conductance mechanosensitive channel